ncbi:hypothetical protein D3C81_912790 [compost metagenome]
MASASLATACWSDAEVDVTPACSAATVLALVLSSAPLFCAAWSCCIWAASCFCSASICCFSALMTAESLSSLLAALPLAAPAPPTRPAPAGPWMVPLALAEDVEAAESPASVLLAAAACAASSAGAVKRRVLVTLASLAVTI